VARAAASPSSSSAAGAGSGRAARAPLVLVVALVALAESPPVSAQSTLITENHVVTITVNCEEGNVTCDDVTYHGVSRISGAETTLRGATMHTSCADGVTPCRFLGYEFTHGARTYRVYETGLLQVSGDRSKVLSEERGTWRW
jgi:hypothetical protein